MSTSSYAPPEGENEQARVRRAAQVSAAPTLAGGSSPTVDVLRHLQRTAGNGAVNMLLRQYAVQRRGCSGEENAAELSGPSGPVARQGEEMLQRAVAPPPSWLRRKTVCDDQGVCQEEDDEQSSQQSDQSTGASQQSDGSADQSTDDGQTYTPAGGSTTDGQSATASSGADASGQNYTPDNGSDGSGQNYTPAGGDGTGSQDTTPDDGGGGMSTQNATSDSGSDGSDGGQSVAPPAQQDAQDGGCDSITPSDQWSVTSVAALSAADGIALSGMAFVLKDMQPNGCEHHMSFAGVGLGIGGKIKGKALPVSLANPSATTFHTVIPVTADEFNTFGRLWVANVDVGPGIGIGRMQFSAFKTDPEALDIGGLEGGLGAGAMALVGRFSVS